MPGGVRNQSRTKEICGYAKEKGLGVIILNSNEASRGDDDSFDAMKSYAKEQGYNWYYALIKTMKWLMRLVQTEPRNVSYSIKMVNLFINGAIDDNPQDPGAVSRVHLKEAINEILNGKPVSVNKSRSVGCSINVFNHSLKSGSKEIKN
jgi:hypothetical protein